jgi:hypothetical protein
MMPSASDPRGADVQHRMSGRLRLKIHRLADIPVPSKTGPWGGWTLYGDNNSLHLLVDGNEIYGIHLDEIHDAPSMLDWVMQVSHKRWATDKILADLVHALDQLFDPQKNFCPLGRASRTTGIAAGKSLRRKLPIGSRVRLACDPTWRGQVIGRNRKGVTVYFAAIEASSLHRPAALELIEKKDAQCEVAND